jgi:hypothetical protein
VVFVGVAAHVYVCARVRTVAVDVVVLVVVGCIVEVVCIFVVVDDVVALFYVFVVLVVCSELCLVCAELWVSLCCRPKVVLFLIQLDHTSSLDSIRLMLALQP